jgi:exodeoxyribonuclease V beta subunit
MSRVADWRDAPLHGRLLIEASAGTGKTWTMAALYLRLLLGGAEGGSALTPERIVVATYTEAAAQELGERLRTRVTQALRAATLGVSALDASDPVQAWLDARWHDADTRESDRQRLLKALATLDRAPIGTLHGLCHRLLLDHPLEGGLGFAPPRLGDGRRVHEAIARDLLRRIGAGDAPPEALELPSNVRRFDALVDAVGFVLQPGAHVAPTPGDACLRGALDADTERTLRDLLNKDGHYTHATNAVLNGVKAAVAYLDDGTLPKSLAKLLDPDEVHKDRVLPAARTKVLAPAFQAAIRRFEMLREQHASPDRAFWAHWTPMLRRWRALRSAELDELGFDPLIERVREVMTADDSPLPDAAFARWPVALVDEFQDTDGTQYALLDRWYRDAGGVTRGLLAMVGDPKQAIYGFRGGDVQAYLRAKAETAATLRLGVNQRSSTAYVAACNALFAGPRATLSSTSSAAIRYTHVDAAGRADASRLHERGAPVERPLVIHRHPRPEVNTIARPKAIDACADLIVDLLEPGRFTFGAAGRALAPGDLAVLLRTNAEIDDLRRALQRRGVPCAGHSRQQVFDGATARDLLLALHAMQHPSDAGALRAALVTPLLRVPLGAVSGPGVDASIDAWRERFMTWRGRWQREGVMSAVLALLDAAQPTLAEDRERITTDLRHLGELLQAQEAEGHAPASLLDWLRAQRRGEDDGSEADGERSLRLESDARRVRLMTLHASKGLEFSVVLLPTLWGHEARARSRALQPADTAGRREAVFEPDAMKRLRDEEQDERFRLLYVALTRAVQACHLFVLPEDRPAQRAKAGARTLAPKSDPERSALDALLSRWPQEERDAAPGIEWRMHWPLPPDTPFDAAAHVDGDVHVGVGVDAGLSPKPKTVPGPFMLPTRWSFSRLAGGHERRAVEAAAADDEQPRGGESIDHAIDHAIDDAIDDAIDKTPGPTTLDAGTRAAVDAALGELVEVGGVPFGNALHALLESHTPGQRYRDVTDTVQAALARHAVRIDGRTPLPVIAQRVAAMLDRVLDAPITLHAGTPPLRLGALPEAARRPELGFHFVLREASLTALRTACAAHGEPTLVPPGAAERLAGWMEGSIDLVFEHADRAHVLDWKSNALAQADAALPLALEAKMDASHYRFQALLYTVALHRMLRQRLGARYRMAEHLGAPVYVFLRAAGLAPELGLGVWSRRFPDALVEAVDAALAGGAA